MTQKFFVCGEKKLLHDVLDIAHLSVEPEALKYCFLLFSDGQAGGDDPRAPEQQQYPLQSTGQAVHTEDSGPAPFKVHKPEEQQRQRRRQGHTGERKILWHFLAFTEKLQAQEICTAAQGWTQQVFHIKLLQFPLTGV